MSSFKERLVLTGYSVDTQTGEIQKIAVSDAIGSVKKRVGKYIEPSYTQEEIDLFSQYLFFLNHI